jgi:hypothetical protein
MTVQDGIVSSHPPTLIVREDMPDMDNLDTTLNQLILRITVWAELEARHVLEKGHKPNVQEMELARRAGIQCPEEVLLLIVPSLPVPEENDLKRALQRFCLVTPETKGLTIGYNVFLLRDAVSPMLLAHQFLKIAQYESCEGIPAFLKQYISEIRLYGYSHAPMEQEALRFASEFSTQPDDDFARH